MRRYFCERFGLMAQPWVCQPAPVPQEASPDDQDSIPSPVATKRPSASDDSSPVLTRQRRGPSPEEQSGVAGLLLLQQGDTSRQQAAPREVDVSSYDRTHAMVRRAERLMVQGDVAPAEAMLRQALTKVRAARDPLSAVGVGRGLAYCALAANQLPIAQQRIQAVLNMPLQYSGSFTGTRAAAELEAAFTTALNIHSKAEDTQGVKDVLSNHALRCCSTPAVKLFAAELSLLLQLPEVAVRLALRLLPEAPGAMTPWALTLLLARTRMLSELEARTLAMAGTHGIHEADMWMYLHRLYATSGQHSRARVVLAHAVNSDANHPEAVAALESFLVSPSY